MIHAIYIEEEVADHPRVDAICDRFPAASRIPCRRYSEVFNPRSQNFRLQKRRPSVILARKFDGHVLQAPPDYGIGGTRNFYFSHMLNCIYDCRYCFLQGMYRSAHYVLFVNYEDFVQEIDNRIAEHSDTDPWFFSGYDCDSLALEPVTGFVDHILPFFAARENAWLELRTKSTQVRSLLSREPVPNCVVAFSLSPASIADAVEHRAPDIQRRLETMQRLERQGWLLGLRFDPVIYDRNYRRLYRELFEAVFSQLSLERIHSVSLGPFRLPKQFMHNIERLYPDEALFAGPLQESGGMVSYQRELEQELLQFCACELRKYIPESIFFPCVGAM